jgi:biopolymer transport protein ExbB/TolQ
MENAYAAFSQLFYHIANAFFWPVAAALLLLLPLSLADLGALLVEIWRRRRQSRTDLPAVARSLAAACSAASRRPADLREISLSPSLRRFWSHLEGRLSQLTSREHLDLWLDEAFQTQEIAITARLDRTRALVRLGPMLGLAGTIIPLGPALQSLLGGDLAGMVQHLVIGFGAVVCGLTLSGVAYVTTLARERWARADLKEMENLCELILRYLQPSPQRTVSAQEADVAALR